MERIISKSQFKPHVLKYFRDIQKTGKPLIISDHGKPVIKIVPYTDNTQEIIESLRGTVCEYAEPFEPVGLDDWEVLR